MRQRSLIKRSEIKYYWHIIKIYCVTLWETKSFARAKFSTKIDVRYLKAAGKAMRELKDQLDQFQWEDEERAKKSS